MKRSIYNILFSVLLISGMAIAVSSANSTASGLPANAPEKPAGTGIEKFSVREGKRIYNHLCLACHGATGRGSGPNWVTGEVNPADLTKYKESDHEHIFQTIKNGSIGVGKSNLCPSWKNNISDEEIGYIISFIDTLKK